LATGLAKPVGTGAGAGNRGTDRTGSGRFPTVSNSKFE
jgi:hypothetical protein